MDYEKKAVFIALVAERRQTDALLSELRESGVILINVMYGKGAAKEGFLKNMLGLVAEENKIVVTCVTGHSKADAVLQMLVEKFNFDKPNTGMAFTIPIEAVSY